MSVTILFWLSIYQLPLYSHVTGPFNTQTHKITSLQKLRENIKTCFSKSETIVSETPWLPHCSMLYQHVCLSTCLLACMPVSLTTCMSACLHTCIFDCLPVYLSVSLATLVFKKTVWICFSCILEINMGRIIFGCH